MVFPGTEIEKIAYSSGLLSKEFSWCDPYYNKLNDKLNQLSNIPIFMDRLSSNTLITYNQKLLFERRINYGINIASNMNYKDLVIRWYNSIRQHGLRNLHSRNVFSPTFYYKLIKAKILGSINT